MYVCVCERVQVWVSVRVHTCMHAQAESHCGWERGNVGSAGGLLQGRSYTQKTLEKSYPHVSNPKPLPPPQTLGSSLPGSPTYTSDPASPNQIYFPSHLFLHLSFPSGVQSSAGPRHRQDPGTFLAFPSCSFSLLHPFLSNPSPTSVVSTASHNCSHHSIPLPQLNLQPSFQSGPLL